MKKAALLSILAVVLTLCEARTEAQQPGKTFRIGFLDPSTASGSTVLVDAFRQELSKLGWIEGKNITIEYRFAENKGRLPELAAELVRLKVDLIVVTGLTPALAAKGATTTIPIVMTTSADPVAKYQKARDTQGRNPQPRPSWTFAAGGRRCTDRPPNERAQTCGAGAEAKIGGDRDSTRR
jgi:ABC-type uncharacterized transport system substrate-binding protein